MADWGKWWRRSRSMSRTVYMRVVRWLATWFRVLRRFAGKSALVSSVLTRLSPRVEPAATVAPEVKQPVLQHASRRPQPCMLCGSSPPMVSLVLRCSHAGTSTWSTDVNCLDRWRTRQRVVISPAIFVSTALSLAIHLSGTVDTAC